MLQIGPNQPKMLPMVPPAPTGAAPAMPEVPPTDPEAQGPPGRTPKYNAEKVSQEAARYFPPDCRCKNCDFYNADDSSCHVVAEQVDPEGICSLHSCAADQGNKDDGTDSSSEPTDGPAPEGEVSGS